MSSKAHHVGLYVSCLVDLMRPSVGFASVKLLETAGCQVTVPKTQTCCGQPAYNSGDVASARVLAQAVLEHFEQFDYVVVPSGSCAAMLKVHMPTLFANHKDQHRAVALAGRVFELTQFLVHVEKFDAVEATFRGKVAYHDGCSSLRELAIEAEPRQLLRKVSGVELVDLPDAETCCGFGGTFSVTYPEISNAMVTKKCAAVTETMPDMLTGSELGCLLNLAGKLHRSGTTVACRHIAEVLAGDFSSPAIGAEAKHT